MKIIYPYITFPSSSAGGHIHVNQFIKNIESMGHQIITKNGDPERNDPGYGNDLWSTVNQIKNSDVIYYRIEDKAPCDRMHNAFVRKIVNNPLIVWEFNTVPEYAFLSGMNNEGITREKSRFKSVAKHCDLAICVSKELAQYVKKEFKIKKVCFVPNGSDPGHFRSDLDPVKRIYQSPDILNVVWVGSAGIGWHDFDLMKKSAIHLCQNGYELKIHFHVIGSNVGSMSDMPLNISYYGPESYSDLPKWLSAMDVGLVLYKEGPAHYNSPLKLFDYMASGLCIIATKQPQVQDIFIELGCQDLLIEAGDYKAVAEKLIWLLDNKAKTKYYGDKFRNLLINKYTWKLNAEKIMNEIDTLLNK